MSTYYSSPHYQYQMINCLNLEAKLSGLWRICSFQEICKSRCANLSKSVKKVYFIFLFVNQNWYTTMNYASTINNLRWFLFHFHSNFSTLAKEGLNLKIHKKVNGPQSFWKFYFLRKKSAADALLHEDAVWFIDSFAQTLHHFAAAWII